MNGKGSRRRPQYVDDRTFEENWDAAFSGWPDGIAPGTPGTTCTCARMDNSYGRGRGGNGKKWGWWISADCPLHGSKT